MSEYRIEKVRRAVTVVMMGGETLAGDVFLQPSARYRAGPQEPAELFNEADAFLPLATTDGRAVLVAKDRITMVQVERLDADTPPSAGTAVDLVFADGSQLSGALHMETRASRSRLLDFLNETEPRFIPLRTPGLVCLVNRRCIAQVVASR